jgi:TetR/AcrR family transcriptional repressor of bet genes
VMIRTPDAKRATVAMATLAVVERSGLAGASMREIAKEAGCSTGVLSHYFRNKEEILDFAFTLAVSQVWDRTVARSKELRGPEALIAALIEALPRDERGRLEVSIYLAFLASAAHDPRRAAEFRRRYEIWSELIASLVSPAAVNHSTMVPVRELAEVLLAAVDGLSIAALADPERYSPQRQVDIVRLVVDRALATPKSNHLQTP